MPMILRVGIREFDPNENVTLGGTLSTANAADACAGTRKLREDRELFDDSVRPVVLASFVLYAKHRGNSPGSLSVCDGATG